MAQINKQALEIARKGRNYTPLKGKRHQLYRSSELLKPDTKIGGYLTLEEANDVKKHLDEKDPLSTYYAI